MPITLTVVRGPQAGRTFTLAEHDTFLVGRSSSAHFSLPADPYFSRHHFLIEANPPLCRLTDLDSHNGTKVNGRPVRTAELADGDEVEAGQTVLKVSVRADGEAATRDLPASSAPTPRSDVTLTAPAEPPAAAKAAGPPPVPGYRDLVELGRGGMGIVYRAVRESDGAAVAVKTIRPAVAPVPNAVARFLREARILESLVHPRIVRFHQMGEAGGVIFFVMDLVAGTDAARLVKDRGPLPVAEAAELAAQLCDGLAHAHARGFVHRDVKPGNLLLAGEPGRWDVRVADFGLARAYQASPMSGLTMSGDSAGTPAFMAPEQVTDFRGVRPAADQYAAAATAFHLLAGRPPFAGPSSEVLKKVLAGAATPLEELRPDVPAAVAAALRRAMALDPADRFPDAAALAAELRRAGG